MPNSTAKNVFSCPTFSQQSFNNPNLETKYSNKSLNSPFLVQVRESSTIQSKGGSVTSFAEESRKAETRDDFQKLSTVKK